MNEIPKDETNDHPTAPTQPQLKPQSPTAASANRDYRRRNHNHDRAIAIAERHRTIAAAAAMTAQLPPREFGHSRIIARAPSPGADAQHVKTSNNSRQKTRQHS